MDSVPAVAAVAVEAVAVEAVDVAVAVATAVFAGHQAVDQKDLNVRSLVARTSDFVKISKRGFLGLRGRT